MNHSGTVYNKLEIINEKLLEELCTKNENMYDGYTLHLQGNHRETI